MSSAISLLISCSIFVPREPGNKSHHPQSPIWVEGSDTTGAPKGSLIILLSPPQCHAALGASNSTTLEFLKLIFTNFLIMILAQETNRYCRWNSADKGDDNSAPQDDWMKCTAFLL
jgi:hypothetical protein